VDFSVELFAEKFDLSAISICLFFKRLSEGILTFFGGFDKKSAAGS